MKSLAKKRKRRVVDPNLPRLSYSPREFADRAGISVEKLYKDWRNGVGPPYRMVGSRRVIEAEGGRRWLAAKS
jgi:hypothetical protein